MFQRQIQHRFYKYTHFFYNYNTFFYNYKTFSSHGGSRIHFLVSICVLVVFVVIAKFTLFIITITLTQIAGSLEKPLSPGWQGLFHALLNLPAGGSRLPQWTQ